MLEHLRVLLIMALFSPSNLHRCALGGRRFYGGCSGDQSRLMRCDVRKRV